MLGRDDQRGFLPRGQRLFRELAVEQLLGHEVRTSQQVRSHLVQFETVEQASGGGSQLAQGVGERIFRRA
ncbi:hypothetical protein D9M68_579180 [compost metagenome]